MLYIRGFQFPGRRKCFSRGRYQVWTRIKIVVEGIPLGHGETAGLGSGA